MNVHSNEEAKNNFDLDAISQNVMQTSALSVDKKAHDHEKEVNHHVGLLCWHSNTWTLQKILVIITKLWTVPADVVTPHRSKRTTEQAP